MKSLLKISISFFIYLFSITSCVVSETAYPQPVSVSFQVFYDELSPYGRWIHYPPHGYVWMPVGYPGFYPYATGGQWVYTDFGWTWVSDFAWGWAPFHYGRWFFDVSYGWMWIPGDVWGPAWVVWVNSPGYYGWIPMMPGYGYHIHSYPVEYWTFVPAADFGKPGVYYGPRTNNAAIVRKAEVIDNTVSDQGRNAKYYSGPRKDDVQAATGRQIKPAEVAEASKPTQSFRNNQLKIYRPEIKKTTEAGEKPAPSKATRLKDVKPAEKNIQAPRDKTDVQKEIPIKKGEQQPTEMPGKKGETETPERKQPDINKGERQPQQVTPKPERKNIYQPIPEKKPDVKQREVQPRQQQPSHQGKPAPQQNPGKKREK